MCDLPHRFADLQPGDEIVAFREGARPCRAKIREHRGAYVIAVLWNLSAARWNNHSVQVKPDQVAQYPDGK
jgi:hypothetical protein